jgi:hypothetical protein
MKAKNQTGRNKAEHGGNTTRTSSQGRKTALGGNTGKRGNPEMDDATHSPKAGQKKVKRIGEKKEAVS